MQKALLKVYIQGKKKPLFECEIVDNVEDNLKKLMDQVNDKSLETVQFGQVGFKRSLFSHYEINYK